MIQKYDDEKVFWPLEDQSLSVNEMEGHINKLELNWIEWITEVIAQSF